VITNSDVVQDSQNLRGGSRLSLLISTRLAPQLPVLQSHRCGIPWILTYSSLSSKVYPKNPPQCLLVPTLHYRNPDRGDRPDFHGRLRPLCL